MKADPIPTATLLSALRWRYATKVFDPDRTIPPDTWAALEDALVLSASSFGLQPYRFLVILDRGLRQQLLPHAWGQRQVVDASHLVVFAARTSVTPADIEDFIQRLAQTRGVSSESLADYHQMMSDALLSPDFQSWVRHWTARQAYLALGNLLTCAALLGVDACPMEGFDPAGFDQVLSLAAQGLTAVVCCALGYRAADDKYGAVPKFRFPKSELIKTL